WPPFFIIFYDSSLSAFFFSLRSLNISNIAPGSQYVVIKPIRNIINQNPIVNIVKNAKKPKY
ncbi:MAG: hypothetical protein KJP09_03775, partial [Bacteroidia bacterium]|nr:hypothetical protein [Bacteroidia bacterium]